MSSETEEAVPRCSGYPLCSSYGLDIYSDEPDYYTPILVIFLVREGITYTSTTESKTYG